MFVAWLLSHSNGRPGGPPHYRLLFLDLTRDGTGVGVHAKPDIICGGDTTGAFLLQKQGPGCLWPVAHKALGVQELHAVRPVPADTLPGATLLPNLKFPKGPQACALYPRVPAVSATIRSADATALAHVNLTSRSLAAGVARRTRRIAWASHLRHDRLCGCQDRDHGQPEHAV